jgi:glyoxylase-like metal-dependent hydrolase (beta-lactamase superfamily II)
VFARVSAPRIHHLNCGTMCPFGERLFAGSGSLVAPARLVAHVLLVELGDGLALVDTGYGTEDVRNPRQLTRGFRLAMRPVLSRAETAYDQVRALGFEPEDVRNIVLTHADIDHGGGVPDFPNADVHIFGDEHRALVAPPLRERVRYAIAAPHYRHGPKWVTHELAGDSWHGFESVEALSTGAHEILMVPLPGHTLGHTGVAVRRGEGWILHSGDAFFHRGEIERPPSCPPGLRAFQALVQAHGKLRVQNQERLRELAARHGDQVQIVCAHDPVQLEQAQARSEPA